VAAICAPAKAQNAHEINVLSYMGSGRTFTAAANMAIDHAIQNNKSVYIPDGLYDIEPAGRDEHGCWGILNKGVSIRAYGAFFFAAATLADDCDYIRFSSGYHGPLIHEGYVVVGTDRNGVGRGRHGLSYYGSTPGGITRLTVRHTVTYDGLKGSCIAFDNNETINFQGVPATSLIEHNVCFAPLFFYGAGDSITIQHNTLRGCHLPLVWFASVAGIGGYGSQLDIGYNNMVGCKGAIYVARARLVNVHQNNIEQNYWTGNSGKAYPSEDGSNKAILDFSGDFGPVYGINVNDNLISNHSAGIESGIRIGSVHGSSVGKNRFYSNTPMKAVAITGAALYATIEAGNFMGNRPVEKSDIANEGWETRFEQPPLFQGP
jgi:hypothetical protein